jgi:hypothetical protein
MLTLADQLDSKYGGHLFRFKQPHPSHYVDNRLDCVRCGVNISIWELDEGLWPARAGRYCPEVLYQISPTKKEEQNGY